MAFCFVSVFCLPNVLTAQSSPSYAILFDLIDNGGVESHSAATNLASHSLIGQPAVLTYSKSLTHVLSSGAGCAFCGSQITVAVEPTILPMIMRLYQNYPNPFNPSTTIRYSLERESLVELSVFNLLGEKVAVILRETQPPGDYTVDYVATNLSGGVYIYRLSTEHGQLTRRFVLLK
ncbi:MAG: T9SS type A sorting domain-containing protein [Bacteroidetes bacterium]|nr:T9SS type A sorting domain-containing protein [Bacteroidota bacterium]